jgi:paired amphipathic helix protein Sin3a
MVQLMTTEDGTLDNEELSPEARWSYYVSAFTMRDPTEGVPFSQMRMPFLKRNLPPQMDSDEEYNRFYKPLISHDGLIIRICANSYHILYEPGTEDWWYRVPISEENPAEKAKEDAAVKEKRKDRFKEKFVNNPSWAHGLSKNEVDQSNQRFRSWVGDAEAQSIRVIPPENKPTEAQGKSDQGEREDEEMADATPAVVAT